MKRTAQSQQLTFEALTSAALQKPLAPQPPQPAPAPLAPPPPAAQPPLALAPALAPQVPGIKTTAKLVGQPFISPIANIPTNRTPLSPTFKLR